jgi:hypothetical protein
LFSGYDLAMTEQKRLFLILWAAGMAGVLSFLLVDLEALVALVPVPEEQRQSMPPWFVLKLASVVQPGVLTTIAVLVGLWLAPKVGLHAPASEALAGRRDFWDELRPQVVPGIIAGIFSGIAIAGSWGIARPWVSDEFAARAESFNKMMPAVVRFLYGGLTEEVLLRWGVMTLFIWVLWRLLGKRAERPAGWIFVLSILASALLFGIGHLPIASLLAGGELTVSLAIYVIAANSLFGIVAGFLYWKRGLESAMIAHIFTHVMLLAAVVFAM